MGRYEQTPAVVLAVSAALACLAVTTRLVISAPMLQATLSGVTVFGAGLLLLRVWAFPGANVSKPVVLTLITLAAVLPELTIGVDSSWGGSGGSAAESGSLALAGITGASRLLIGLAWPLVILLRWARGGGSVLRLDRRDGVALWLLLLASLYSLTVYLRGTLSVLDSLCLLLLFGVYLWVVSRSRERATEQAGPPGGVVAPLSRMSRPFVVAALACAVAATAVGTLTFADAVVAVAEPMGADRFTSVQWLLPMVSKLPLLAIVAVLVWDLRTGRATAALLLCQTGYLTVVLGSLPLVSLVQGVVASDITSLALDERERSELLLMCAQTVFLVVAMARMTVSVKAAVSFLALFFAQAVLSLLQLDGQSTLAQTVPASVYVAASVGLIAHDRGRLQALVALAPVRDSRQTASTRPRRAIH